MGAHWCVYYVVGGCVCGERTGVKDILQLGPSMGTGDGCWIAGVCSVGKGVLSSLSQALIALFSGGSMLGLQGLRLPPAGFLLLLPFLLLLLLPAAPAPHRVSYKPVIVVHGLFDSSYSFRHLLEYINEVWQGTPGCGRWRRPQ